MQLPDSRFFFNFVAFLPTHLKCHMSVNFSGVEFLGPHPSLKKKKEKEIFVVVFTSSIKRPSRSRALTAKMCSKKFAARAKLLCPWPLHLPVGRK